MCIHQSLACKLQKRLHAKRPPILRAGEVRRDREQHRDQPGQHAGRGEEEEVGRNLVVAGATALTPKGAEKLRGQEARYVRVVEELRDCSL